MDTVSRIRQAVNRERLLDTATKLVAAPSRTGEADLACAALEQILVADGFHVERPEAGHPDAPAVVTRLDSGKPGRTLQFDGHLDTVHLPFVPPAVKDGHLTGSGAVDMKGGVAAMVEAVRALRDAGLLTAGSVLLTAHDLHEAPWGMGQQLDALIEAGYVGDAVLIPEYVCTHLPIVGRGLAIWKATVERSGQPIHEVMRPAEQPSVIAAGAELVLRLSKLDATLANRRDPMAGQETVFIGQFHSGEIYNQYPKTCRLEGTRRWLPGVARGEVEREFRDLLDRLARDAGVSIHLDWVPVRDAFKLDLEHQVVKAFQQAHSAVTGRELAHGPKAFVDDGNCFWGQKKLPAITHGPRGGGAHTVNEWVEIDDLVRVAQVYALTAIGFCATQR